MEIVNPPLGTAGELTPLSRLAEQHDVVLCDIWGVVHNGVAAFEGAVDALCKLRARGRLVILITNAPRFSQDIYPQLHRLGVPRAAFDAIVTSGDVTATLIAQEPGAPLFHFGSERDRSVLEGLTNPIVALPDAKICLLTGPLDDAIETVEIYHNSLLEMQDTNITMICANSDPIVQSGTRMVICVGSIAQHYALLGGKVLFAGKPEAEIYDEALRQAAILAGRETPKNRFLAIGDGLPTDIKGAAENGFDACFITGGIHTNRFGAMSRRSNVTKAVATIKGTHPHLNLLGFATIYDGFECLGIITEFRALLTTRSPMCDTIKLTNLLKELFAAHTKRRRQPL